MTTGYDRRGDIFSKTKDIYFEVKYDILSDKTNNFFVEQYALEHTSAFYYVFVDDSYYYFIRLSVLKELIEDSESKFGGDDKKFKGHLVPKVTLACHAKKYIRTKRKDLEWYRDYLFQK